MNKRYVVWHGFAVTRFSNREKAKAFAFENSGTLIDDWSGNVIPIQTVTPIRYWVFAGEDTMVEFDPAEIVDMNSRGWNLVVRVSPA